MDLKKWMSGLLCGFLLIGCQNTGTQTPQEWNMADAYSALDTENVYVQGTQDSLEKMLNHGTGVIFLGFPECPWCQLYVPMLNEDASKIGVEILYYNIYTDKSEDRDYYDRIASLIDEKDSSIIHYDNDGSMVIYMPLVLFVQEGEIIAYDDETSDLDSHVVSPDTYWNEEKSEALHQRLSTYLLETKTHQDAKNAEGCGIKIEPDCDSDGE